MATTVWNCAPVTRFTLTLWPARFTSICHFGCSLAPVRLKNHCLGGLLGVLCGPLFAHAHLQQAAPADGSHLQQAPAQLVLSFSEPARLVVLTIARHDGAPQKLTSLPATPQQRITVPLPALSAGDYVIAWRVVGTDGHVVPGGLHFTLMQ
jgi:methionine-rich copper-binding protein CopC